MEAVATGATILTFPGRRHRRGHRTAIGELELGLAQRAGGPALPTARQDRVRAVTPAGEGWAIDLLALVPALLSPKAAGLGDLVAVGTAACALALLRRTAPRLAGLIAGHPAAAAEWRDLALALAAALAGAATLGRGPAAVMLVFALLEAARHALRRMPAVAAFLLAAGVALRLDAGGLALGLNVPEPLLAAGGLLGLFLALLPVPAGADRRASRTTTGLWQCLVLLGLAAGICTLYAAGLGADPWLGRAAGPAPLASVPLLLLALLRLWRLRDQGGAARVADPWLTALAAAWASLVLVADHAASLL